MLAYRPKAAASQQRCDPAPWTSAGCSQNLSFLRHTDENTNVICSQADHSPCGSFDSLRRVRLVRLPLWEVVEFCNCSGGRHARADPTSLCAPFRSTRPWGFQKWSFPSAWDPRPLKHFLRADCQSAFLNFLFFCFSPQRPPSLPTPLPKTCVLLYFTFSPLCPNPTFSF